MAEALFNASGLGLPIVMTVANRAIGAPINIWNDHSDAMSMRDSGWIQLFAESNQEAVDLHVQAFRLAESLSVPVMVCMDGFVLTHAFEEVDLPDQEQVDAFLPPFVPQQQLDPDDPVTIGAMVGPEAFAEVKYLMHAKQVAALDEIPRDRRRLPARRSAGTPAGCSSPTGSRTPRPSSSRSARCSAPSRTSSTTCATRACAIGVLGITCFRPWPIDEVREALRARASGWSSWRRRSRSVPAASSGRTPATPPAASRSRCTTSWPASADGRSPGPRCAGSSTTCSPDRLDPTRLHFLDLDHALVAARAGSGPGTASGPGPHAEHMLRDIGTVASGAYE